MSGPNARRPSVSFVRGLVAAFALAATVGFYLSQPGPPPGRSDEGERGELASYAVGYLLALALTAAAFAVAHWQAFGGTTALAVVLALGLVQIVAHFRFFLHISLKASARDDLQLILFSTLIVGLMVSGTLVILFNLRARMM